MIDSQTLATHGSNEIGSKSVCIDQGRGILGTGTKKDVTSVSNLKTVVQKFKKMQR